VTDWLQIALSVLSFGVALLALGFWRDVPALRHDRHVGGSHHGCKLLL
jgi:hypothetical protein